MVDEKLEVVQEEVLVVGGGFEVVFEEFACEIYVSKVLDHELSIVDDDVGDDTDVGGEDGEDGFIETARIVVLFGSELELDVTQERLEVL